MDGPFFSGIKRAKFMPLFCRISVTERESERLGTRREEFKAGRLNIFYLDSLTQLDNEPFFLPGTG